jgi:hypothetical protein
VPTVSACAAAGAGFLLAVLWFDLMFDVQASGYRGRELPEQVLASIGGYYARVTTAARPMNRLVALVMLGTLAALVAEVVDAKVAAWVAWTSLAFALVPIGLAGARIVPRAVRLGTRQADATVESRLARSILREHVLCAIAIAVVLVLQLAVA